MPVVYVNEQSLPILQVDTILTTSLLSSISYSIWLR